MQDTRTPYLQLSNLEEGVYTFTLKVTDSAGQSSTVQVHVFVKPPTNKPPIAEAGGNITISLPQTWAIVDASNSSDDNKITAFKWEQVEGPSRVQFENNTVSKTNVTGLTKGNYIFKVSVTDDNNNVASDTVYVVVNQSKFLSILKLFFCRIEIRLSKIGLLTYFFRRESETGSKSRRKF